MISQNEAIIGIEQDKNLKFHASNMETYLAWCERLKCVCWYDKKLNIDLNEAKLNIFSKQAKIQKFMPYRSTKR